MHLRVACPDEASNATRPPLVLLHMTPLSGSMHESIMPLLATDRLVVAPDRLGFGYSDKIPEPLPMETYAAATLEALDALDLGIQQFDALGTHSGSVESVELGYAHPERVRRVGMVAVPAYTEQELEDRRYRFGGYPGPTEDGSHLEWHWQRRFLYRQPPWDLPLFQWRLVQELLAGPDAWFAYKAVFEYPLRQRLLALRQPILVLGPHDDLWEQTDRSRAWLPPNARFVDLPHLALDIFYYATEEIARLIRGFLDAPDEAAIGGRGLLGSAADEVGRPGEHE